MANSQQHKRSQRIWEETDETEGDETLLAELKIAENPNAINTKSDRKLRSSKNTAEPKTTEGIRRETDKTGAINTKSDRKLRSSKNTGDNQTSTFTTLTPQSELTQEDRDEPEWNVAALNIHSLKARKGKKLDVLEDLISAHNIKVLSLTETWTKYGKKYPIDIPNFTYVRFDRCPQSRFRNSRGGGINVYIHNSIQYTVNSFGQSFDNNIQFVDVTITHPNRLSLVSLYNPHLKYKSLAVKTIGHILEKNNTKGLETVFMGDMNFNMNVGTENPMDQQTEALLNDYEDTYGAMSHIKFPTRTGTITRGKGKGKEMESCIDVIYSNSKFITAAMVVRTDNSKGFVSDHHMVKGTIRKPEGSCTIRKPESSYVSRTNTTLKIKEDGTHVAVTTTVMPSNNFSSIKSQKSKFPSLKVKKSKSK